MTPARRILAVTGSRAEYGLLRHLLRKLAADPRFELRLVVTGAHLSPVHGHTVDEIRADGFTVDAEVEMLLCGDDRRSAAKSVGLGMIGLADAYGRLKPEAVILLGDRMEMMAAATAAVICGVPIAHIHGGEATDGAFDEYFRHAITKMSHLHFASTEAYCKRIRQMGEIPANVYHTGALGVENLHRTPVLGPVELKERFGRDLAGFDLLVTLHPETAGGADAQRLLEETLGALERFASQRILFTGANADPAGARINDGLRRFVAADPEHRAFYMHLGMQGYLSALRRMAAVVGNSSSGIIEAPSLRVPTVNIGDRQKGRERAASVIDCPVQRDAIAEAIRTALDRGGQDAINPYDRSGTSDRIIEVLSRVAPASLTRKPFHDLQFHGPFVDDAVE